MSKQDYTNYLSPFSWRYGTTQMRQIFSEQHKYEIWRKIWVALAKAQVSAGVVKKKELADLEKHQKEIDIDRILELEKETGHDVVAAIREFAEKATVGGGKIHLGATSMDVNDNGDILRAKEALTLVELKLVNLLKLFSEKVTQYAKYPCLAYTHLNPAEPTTLGYRFAFYAQDLLLDFQLLQFVKTHLMAKGMKGAVGTAASYTKLFEGDLKQVSAMEKEVMDELGLNASLISTQVYSRKIDYLILNLLNSLSSSLAKFAGDIRLLQTPLYGEWAEPFGKKQVGSSAMPFKKNPVNSEKICSLARYVNQLPSIAIENASLSYLERTLDDSANRRLVIPEAFLCVDEILLTAEKLIMGLVINEEKINFNLSQFASFAAMEGILMESVQNGASRQQMHEILRDIAMEAWSDIKAGKENPLIELLAKNRHIREYIKKNRIRELMNVTHHIGNAPQRALKLVKEINKTLGI